MDLLEYTCLITGFGLGVVFMDFIKTKKEPIEDIVKSNDILIKNTSLRYTDINQQPDTSMHVMD